MTPELWALAVIVFLIGIWCIWLGIDMAKPWKKRPEPPKRTYRPRGGYGRGIVPSRRQRDMMDRG